MARMASPPSPPGPRLHFGEFELDVANASLRRAGAAVELPPKSFALLAHLAQHPGELVLKDTLLDTVWGRRFVSEGAVKTVVSELRAALGDDARAPRWIETVQRRGYRFMGTVSAAPLQAAAAPPAVPAAPAPAAAPPPSARGNLPYGLPELTGRERELALVDSLFATGRLVTICGPAGVGKTSLALAAAGRRRAVHAGGAWLAELAPLPTEATDAAALRVTLARALHLAPTGIGDDAALAAALQGLPLLLVLDNAEHLLDVLAPLVLHLWRALPGLHWLVTSREPLQVPGEQVLRLAPLSLPAPGDDDDPARLAASGALSLFVRRVAARLPGFAPGPAQQRAAAQICRALDGLPLALELAAARVPLLGVHGLAEYLALDDDGPRLHLLTQADRTAGPHQRTLRSALDWSHALLKPAEQRVFRRLGVFRGGFTLAAAQVVCAGAEPDRWSVLEALEALAEKSMVVAPAEGAGPARFTLLESLREYAVEQLQAAGEDASTARLHLRWVRDYWTRADAVALLEPVLEWTARHSPELDNLRLALRWAWARVEPARPDAAGAGADPALVADLLALVGHSAMFWQRAGLLAEGARWCQAVHGLARSHPDPGLRAGVALACATLCRFAPWLPAPESLALACSAAQGFATTGDRKREYFAHYLAWVLALEGGEHVDRTVFMASMQALIQPDWNPLVQRYYRTCWAQEERLQGRLQAFLESSREDLATFEQIGAQGETWSAGLGLMWAEHDQGAPERAIAIGRRLVDDIRATGRLRIYAQLATVYTTMLAESGDVAATRPMLAETLPLLPTMSACEILHLAMAWLAWHEGRAAHAALLLGWFDSPQRGGGAYGPRTFTRRTACALAARLAERLGAEELRRLQAAAAALGDAEAIRLGAPAAAAAAAARVLPEDRTDRKPQAS
jgi:predicted ATPase/DNA-binding winged helix-turn-helix (wHTH) protein